VDASVRHFDRWSRTYERDWRSRWMGRIQDDALAALDVGPGDRLLDVGCGTGAAVRRAAAFVDRAVGVDLSPGMIERARSRPDLPSNVEFLVGEAGRLPVDDGTFTALLCTSSFHHYPDPDAALVQMARVLAPGGRLVIADGCADSRAARVVDVFLRTFERSHVRLYRSTELAEMLRSAGFAGLERRSLWDGGYVFIRGAKS
jgi:ubiquinone/menaquinone biosynthesis C-methylase UbiE